MYNIDEYKHYPQNIHTGNCEDNLDFKKTQENSPPPPPHSLIVRKSVRLTRYCSQMAPHILFSVVFGVPLDIKLPYLYCPAQIIVRVTKS